MGYRYLVNANGSVTAKPVFVGGTWAMPPPSISSLYRHQHARPG